MESASKAPKRALAASAGLLLALAVLIGIAAGIGGYTFVYAQGFSYLSSDPQVCANCHIMQSQYDAWQKSGHHHVAVCNDCHLPHGFFSKYVAKAINGFNHGKAYTLQNFAEPIAIKPFNSRILQDNCVDCHRPLVNEMLAATGRGEAPNCMHCHQSEGHGERAGLGGPRT